MCEAAAPAESPARVPAFESQRPVAVPLPLPAQEAAPEAPAGDTQQEEAPESGEQRCAPSPPDDAAFRAPERHLTSRHNTLRPPPAYLRPPPGVSPVMFPMALSASMQLPHPMPPAAAFSRLADEARRAGVPTFAAAMTWPMPYYAEPYGAMPPMFAPPPPAPASMPLAQLCRFWAAGQCAAGAACRFWHADGSAPGWSSGPPPPDASQFGCSPSFQYPFAPWMAPPMPPYFAPFAPHPPPPPPAAAMAPRAGRPAPKEEVRLFAAIDAALSDVQASAERKAERAAVRQRRQAATPCKFFFSAEGCGRAVCRFSHDQAAPPADELA